MTHVYLTEAIIKEALKARSITEREAKELTRNLNHCKRVHHKQPRRAQLAS